MRIKIKKSTYINLIKLLDSSNPKKIAAIKAVRADSGCGLREAKDAVEFFMYEKGLSQHKIITEHKLHIGPYIKKLIVDYGSGEIELDLESMELKALMEMQTIGLIECSDILNLVSVLKAYEDGREIFAVEKNKE
jgi:hypothetical protein